jgi:hypothetical protein
MGRKYWPKESDKLLDNYLRTKNEKDLGKLFQRLGKPWMDFNILYNVYTELKERDVRIVAADLPEMFLDLRLKIIDLMLRGAVHNRYDRYKLYSLYEIAEKEGKADEVLAIIDRWAEICDKGYDARTWEFFWASFPDTKLSKMAERKLEELGKPLPEMTEIEKNLFVVQSIIGMKENIDPAGAKKIEMLGIEHLIAMAGIGNLIGAGLAYLPEGILKNIVFGDLILIHNTARSGSNIRRMVRDELLSRDKPFHVWEGLYLSKAKPGTLLRKLAAIRMLELASSDVENRIAYDAVYQLAPELRIEAGEKILEKIKDPKTLRSIVAQKNYPEISRQAQNKLDRMLTL